MRRKAQWVALIAIAAVGLYGCSESSGSIDGPEPDRLPTPAGFPEMRFPDDNPFSEAKAELGRYLFYDARLSLDRTVSCSSCHLQENAFSDPNRVSFGVDNRTGTRNAPSLTNVGYNLSLLWEGGVLSLEQQAVVPIIHPDEMAMHTDTLVARLDSVPLYRTLFGRAWGDEEITIERITKAVATFERTLVSAHAPFDRFAQGDKSALSEAAERGRKLFLGEKADCFHCHVGYNFTDNLFHNNGLSETEDLGRFELTQDYIDRGKFKTPTLRNIAVTGPYMHDGRFTTLEEVVDFYNDGGEGNPNSDPLVRPLEMTEQEKSDLIAFLHSLTDETFMNDTTLASPWN